MELFQHLQIFGDAAAAANVTHEYLAPFTKNAAIIMSAAVSLVLVYGGLVHVFGAGSPDAIHQARRLMKYALIALVMVFGAAVAMGIISKQYSNSMKESSTQIPAIASVEEPEKGVSLTDVLLKAILGVFRNIAETTAKPFLDALNKFTKATPLMAENSAVFNFWLGTVAIADALFVLVIVLLAFHVLSFELLGLSEIKVRQMIPQIGFIFLLVNTSIFALDLLIGLSNVIINAVFAINDRDTIFEALTSIIAANFSLGLGPMILMVVLLILAVILLLYYLNRLIVLFVGAVLAPFVLLLWLLPWFKDFAETAIKTYIVQIFVLLVHVVMGVLAVNFFAEVLYPKEGSANPLMSILIGIALIGAMVTTARTMQTWIYASSGTRTMRTLGNQFMSGARQAAANTRQVRSSAASTAAKAATK